MLFKGVFIATKIFDKMYTYRQQIVCKSLSHELKIFFAVQNHFVGQNAKLSRIFYFSALVGADGVEH